jgi:hypothetical protein
MLVKNMNFKDAVAALSARLQRLSGSPQTSRILPPPPASSNSSSQLTSIRQILECALANTRPSST